MEDGDDRNRRRELGDFLKYARSRISPLEAGIEPLGPRRVPGLRRNEVAGLCGVSTDWYTWFEMGRPSVTVSPRFVGTVARVLRLRTDETVYLFSLAISEMPCLPSPVREETESALESIVSGWHDPGPHRVAARFERCDELPLGIYCTTPRGEILYANRSLTGLLGYRSMSAYLRLDVETDLYFSPPERKRWQTRIAAAGSLRGVPTKVRRADGRRVVLLDSARAIRAGDTVTHYVGIWEPT